MTFLINPEISLSLIPGWTVVNHLPKSSLNNGYGHLNQLYLLGRLDHLGIEKGLLTIDDANPLSLKGLHQRNFDKINP